MANKEFKVTTRDTYTEDGIRSIEPIDLDIIFSEPDWNEDDYGPQNLTEEDVRGHWDEDRTEKLDRCMQGKEAIS